MRDGRNLDRFEQIMPTHKPMILSCVDALRLQKKKSRTCRIMDGNPCAALIAQTKIGVYRLVRRIPGSEICALSICQDPSIIFYGKPIIQLGLPCLMNGGSCLSPFRNSVHGQRALAAGRRPVRQRHVVYREQKSMSWCAAGGTIIVTMPPPVPVHVTCCDLT
jgi:hypothetical protein